MFFKTESKTLVFAYNRCFGYLFTPSPCFAYLCKTPPFMQNAFHLLCLDKTSSCLCRKNEMMQCIDCMFRTKDAVYRLHVLSNLCSV